MSGSDMKDIIIPGGYNYIGVFLTLACNIGCSYCINEHGELFKRETHLSGEDWIKGLNRLISRDDLPVTFQGGEPSLHKDFIKIINGLKPGLKLDILTNLELDIHRFAAEVNPERLERDAPYAPIRMSYHPESMDIEKIIAKVKFLKKSGFEVGIYGLLHPKFEKDILKVQERCKAEGLDFRTKEFLGFYNGKLYGTYRYAGAVSGEEKKKCLCRTTELLIAPDGKIFRCHRDLYSGGCSIGSILDPDFQIEDIYRKCLYYGECNPCDVKLKTNRLQIFGHTSVEIKDIEEYSEARKK